MISSYDTPGSSPVPRRMARSMFSRGMLFAFASATMVRRRGFMSGSPPPARAATVSSLMRRVKILPRFASSAPFLCLIDAHFEWPDMKKTPENSEIRRKILPQGQPCKAAVRDHFHWWRRASVPPVRHQNPHVRALVPRPSAIVAEDRVDAKSGACELTGHLRHRESPEDELEVMLAGPG